MPDFAPRFTLRTRLVLALVAVSAIGLAAFGVVTYELYQRSLLDQVDNQLDAIVRPQARRLVDLVDAGVIDGTCAAPAFRITGPGDGQSSNPGEGQGLDVFSQLYVGGELVGCVPAISTNGAPSLPSDIGGIDHMTYRTVAASGGGGSWRVLASPVESTGPDGSAVVGNAVVLVAVRTAGVDESMRRLVHIEVVTGLGLLAVLAAGAWTVLWRGLRPLEQMSESAATITAGDLSQRVSPADEHTEVGQLGLALNTMLDGLEGAFAEREATERRLRQFLADASHELRTPLTSIQGFAELYRMGGGDLVPDLPVIMGRIESEATRMRTLVDDLLLLADLDRVRPVRTETVDLSVLAADACTDAVAIAPGRRFVLDAPVPVPVSGDADHLRQAIVNLISNAVRHTPTGTPVEVSARSMPGWAEVSVRDYGPGLNAEGLEHAFDRFWQADAARVGSNTGLGLSIVAGIAAEHGGRVTVSNVVDGGARFTIQLPSK